MKKLGESLACIGFVLFMIFASMMDSEGIYYTIAASGCVVSAVFLFAGYLIDKGYTDEE